MMCPWGLMAPRGELAHGGSRLAAARKHANRAATRAARVLDCGGTNTTVTTVTSTTNRPANNTRADSVFSRNDTTTAAAHSSTIATPRH